MKLKNLFYLLLVAGLVAGLGVAPASAQRGQPVDPGLLADFSDVPRPTIVGGPQPDAWQVVGTFPAYDVSAIGVDYAPEGDFGILAHESSPNPTIYHVDYASHALLGSLLFSTINPGWPAGLDNRDGVEYDPSTSHFFAPDYNGDAAAYDDNIIEYDAQGVILNAWETDNSFGSNDSYDGSAINQIIDIAVAQVTPDVRYFATAAGDGSIVYEINLIKTGAWWTPGTWGTITTWTVPGLGDNVGISYDFDHNVLYHSDFNSTNIVVTDLDGNVLETFSCPGAGGFNTGVGYVEGKAYREIWVTDFSSNIVTMCQDAQVQPCEWQMVWAEDFENGYGAWSMDGLWNPENEADACGGLVAPFPSSSNDAYYGIDGQCTYDNGAANSGSLTMLVDASLAGAEDAEVRVQSYEQTECGGDCGYDNRYVELSTDGGAVWSLLGEGNAENAWYQRSFNTVMAAGGTARLRFRFDTTDDIGNDYFGWMVDNVEIWGCFPAQTDPDISVSPESLYAEQCPDETTTQTLTICNEGGADLTWSLAEAAPKLRAGAVTLPARAASEGKGTAAGPVQARSAGSYTVQGRAGLQAPPDVLLAVADGAAVIEGLLEAYGDLGVVDVFDASIATPTLAELQAYDVVLTWSNYSYLDATAMGNVLADYIDVGGKVSNLNFSMIPWVGYGLAGRFVTENYTAMWGTNYAYSLQCLGTYNAGHPIMAGVTDVCEAFRETGTYLTPGSTEVARWADNELFVAVKDNATVATISGYVGDSFVWTGQMPDVVHNAILWLAGGVFDAPWLSEDPVGGTLAPDTCQDVMVTFDSTGLAAGDYFANLVIDSNDPDEPQVVVPVQLTVDECMDYPDIEVTPVSLSTEQCPDEVTSQTLQVCNVGLADLTWTLSEQPAKQAALVPEGTPVVPQGASSGLPAQPHKARLESNPILVITTSSVDYVLQALNELGYAYDYVYSSDWTGIDFAPYQAVIIGMDGGVVETPSLLKIRTDVVDMGKRAIFLGGTCYQPFAVGVNQYLVLNDVNNYCWSVSSTPHFTVINPADPLAQGLPSPHNFANSSAAYYATRATDLDILTIALNGDGYADFFYKNNAWPVVEGSQPEAGGDLIWLINSPYYSYWADPNDYALLKQVIANSLEYNWAADIPWLSEDPVGGTLAPDTCQDVTVTFDSTGLAAGAYFANLVIDSNDPDEPQVGVPVQLTVEECAVDTLHIANLVFSARMDPYGRSLARWDVFVHNQDHLPLGMVMVDMTITPPSGSPVVRSLYTNFLGKARFHYGHRLSEPWLGCVDNLTKAGYVYEPGDNEVPNCAP